MSQSEEMSLVCIVQGILDSLCIHDFAHNTHEDYMYYSQNIFDWRDFGAINEIRSQEDCGKYYA